MALVGSTMAAPSSGFAFRTASQGCTYLVTVNGEPVKWAHSPSGMLLRGFPLKHGTNHFRVNIVFPPGYTDDILPQPFLAVTALIQDVDYASARPSNWMIVGEFEKWGPFIEPITWESDFILTNSIKSQTQVFDVLRYEDGQLTNECRKLAFKLAKIFQEQDTNTLSKVLALHSAGVSGKLYPPWLTAGATNVATISGISNGAGIVLVTGDRFILAHCTPGNHMAKFSVNRRGVFLIDSFLFGRVNGNWVVNNNDGEWVKMR